MCAYHRHGDRQQQQLTGFISIDSAAAGNHSNWPRNWAPVLGVGIAIFKDHVSMCLRSGCLRAVIVVEYGGRY